jgi:hypothetical protein
MILVAAVAWGVWVVASVRRRVAVVGRGCAVARTRPSVRMPGGAGPGLLPARFLGLSPNPPRPPRQIGSYTQSICG